MKSVLGMLLLALFSASAQATVLVGDLHINKVMCIRAPCPLIVKFTSGGRKPFVVKASPGSQAAKFLEQSVLDKTEAHISVTVEGRISREETLIVEKIAPTENEAPIVNVKEESWIGTLEAQKVMCARAPCPALAVFVNENGIKYNISTEEKSAANTFLDKLNNTMTGGSARLKVKIAGKLDLRSKTIRASTIEVLK